MVDEIEKLWEAVKFLETEADKNKKHSWILAELFEKKLIDEEGNVLFND